MKNLPAFKKRPAEAVRTFISRVLLHPGEEESYLLDLITYQDGHYRALFAPAYFVLAAGQDAPSRSQWNTLKKKIKRHDRLAFTFKDHGTARTRDGEPCYYIDFGFFAG